MQALTENEVNRKLLTEVEEALKGKTERLMNMKARIDELKKKLLQNVDLGFWDQAQAVLDQTKKLAIDSKLAEDDVKQAQSRVDSLTAAIKRAEEKARLDAMKSTYVPYAAEPAPAPAAPAPVPAPAPSDKGPYTPEA